MTMNNIEPTKDILEIIRARQLNYKKPMLIYSKDILKKRLRFFGKFAKEQNVHFLFTIKSFPNRGILKIASEILSGFDVSNPKEHSYLPRNLSNKIIVVNNPTSYSGDIYKYKNQFYYNDIIINLDNIKYINELLSNIEKFRMKIENVTLGLRLSHTNIGLDLSTYPYGGKASRFGEPLEKLPDFYRAVGAPIGVHLHNGSEENTPYFYLATGKSIINFCKENNIELKYLNFGGGLHNLTDAEIEKMVSDLRAFIPNNITILFEPGNALSKDCGFGISKVMSIKTVGNKIIVVMDSSYECNFKWSDPKILGLKASEKDNAVDVHFYGPTCYEDDFFMNIKLDLNNGGLPFREGDALVFSQMFGYCYAWNTSFNGIPEIAVMFV